MAGRKAPLDHNPLMGVACAVQVNYPIGCVCDICGYTDLDNVGACNDGIKRCRWCRKNLRIYIDIRTGESLIVGFM